MTARAAAARDAAPATIGRQAWIDWLKVLVVIGVFVYHAAQPFVLTTWIVVADEKSLLLSGLAGLGYLFGMPLMFLLAGAASWAAVRGGTTRGYVGKRLRLLVPLLVGIMVLSPLQTWIGELSRGHVPAAPIPYAVDFWAAADPPTSPMWLGIYGYHLWFIGFLLIYALLALPVLRTMRPEAWPMRPTARWLVGVPIAALTVMQVPLRIAFPAYRDWADFVLWLTYFLAGAALLAWPGAVDVVRRLGPRMLVIGLLLTAALVPIFLAGGGMALESEPRLDGATIGYVALRSAIGWCWVLAALYIGIRWLDRGATRARAASSLVLPFYVLHHPVVVAVAAVAVPLAWPMWPTFAVIVLVSGAATLGACLAVARTRTLRVLLGMGARPQPAPATVTT